MNVMSNKIYFLYFSFILMILSVILLFIPGLPLGIDFTSGSTITYRWDNDPPSQEQISNSFSDAGFKGTIVQSMGNNEFYVRTSDLGINGKETVDLELKKITGKTPVTLDTNTVGSSVAQNTIRNSVIAVFISSWVAPAFLAIAVCATMQYSHFIPAAADNANNSNILALKPLSF